jgi:signal peptidase I
MLVAGLIAVGVRVVASPYEVDGKSMMPNLQEQERLLVNRSAYVNVDLNRVLNLIPGVDRAGTAVIYPFDAPQRGDVVVLNPPVAHPTIPYVKRIIGLPGEVVGFRDGYVTIDGVRLDEPYIDGPITACQDNNGCHAGKVPDGYVYVLGDNRMYSADSRSFGLVKIDEIVGKAWFTEWPLDRIGLLSD